MIGMNFQEVRDIKLYLCHCFCSQSLVFNFTLSNSFRNQRLNGLFNRNILSWEIMSLRPQLSVEGLLPFNTFIIYKIDFSYCT